MQMNDGQYENLIVVDAEVDAVWEAGEHAAPDFSINDRELEGLLLDSFQKLVEVSDEFDTQPCALSLVPSDGLVDVDLRLNAECQPSAHSLLLEYFCTRRSRTSSQETVSSGLASC